ncbi:hypothetical protein ANCCAN_29198, partial [Ancylostoma caninum]
MKKITHIETHEGNLTFEGKSCSNLGDIGGALGLFLGASMLTIIELVYLCYQYRICGKLFKKTDNRVRE